MVKNYKLAPRGCNLQKIKCVFKYQPLLLILASLLGVMPCVYLKIAVTKNILPVFNYYVEKYLEARANHFVILDIWSQYLESTSDFVVVWLVDFNNDPGARG